MYLAVYTNVFLGAANNVDHNRNKLINLAEINFHNGIASVLDEAAVLDIAFDNFAIIVAFFSRQIRFL